LGRGPWRGDTYSGEDEPVSILTSKVIGEFYWRVQAGETWVARSYERGNMPLSREWREGEEVQWTHLVAVPQRLVDAFRRPEGPDLARPEPTRPKPGGQNREAHPILPSVFGACLFLRPGGAVGHGDGGHAHDCCCLFPAGGFCIK
jgi:hypothetical protein